MQITIEIPDHIYNTVIETGKFFPYRFNTTKAIKNGIILPKHHDRLVDVKDLYANVHGGDYDGAGFSKEYVYCNDIASAPTIIPADRK